MSCQKKRTRSSRSSVNSYISTRKREKILSSALDEEAVTRKTPSGSENDDDVFVATNDKRYL